MKSTANDRTVHPVAPDKLRCIWMTAGILSYHLCDRQFECDHCPLDEAMRMHFTKHHNNENISTTRIATENSLPVNEEYLFTQNHCWLRMVDKNTAQIGLEPEFASVLISLKTIALPSVGEQVQRGEQCCWIILEKGTLPISAPITGKVIGTNARIIDRPYNLYTHPFTQGWLFEMDIDQHELTKTNLLKKSDIEPKYAADVAHFNDLVIEALRGSSMGVGATLQDGGQALRDISEMLGPKKYLELIREAFSKS